MYSFSASYPHHQCKKLIFGMGNVRRDSPNYFVNTAGCNSTSRLHQNFVKFEEIAL